MSGYIIRKINNKHQVHAKGENGQPVGPPLGKHRTRTAAVDHMRQLYSNDDRNMKSANLPSSPDDYAVVPDPKLPSTWKMPIHDRKHLGLAIAALGPSSSAPHGHAAKLSSDERKQALSRIHAKIGELANDDADEQDLRDKLTAHGKKEADFKWFGGDLSQSSGTYATMPDDDYGDDGDDYVGDYQTPKLDPDDPRVNYDPMGGTKSGACANCFFFDADDSACRLVCGDIVPTGDCDLWLRELSSDEEDEQVAMPVKMVESKEFDSDDQRRAFFGKLGDTIPDKRQGGGSGKMSYEAYSSHQQAMSQQLRNINSKIDALNTEKSGLHEKVGRAVQNMARGVDGRDMAAKAPASRQRIKDIDKQISDLQAQETGIHGARNKLELEQQVHTARYSRERAAASSKELQDVNGSDDETYIVNKRGWLDMVKTAIKQVLGLDEQIEPINGFKMFGNDNQYWVALYSNNAQDRDGEWFSQKSHDDFIDRADRGEVPMPYLDFWHSKAYHGQAQWLGREGHVVIAVGTFDDSELAQEMKQYYASAEPGELLTSFGYFYPRSALVEDVYHAYNAFEISPLPAGVAANLHTGFTSLEEFKEITMDAKKQQALARLVGPKAAQLIASAGEQRSKELDTVATSFKDIGNPLEAQLNAMAEAIGLLASQKDTPKSNPGATPKTGKQGQPTKPEEQDDEPADDLDEEDLDNIGSPKSTKESRRIVALEKQVKQLMRALKAKDDSDTEDDDADQEDDEEDDQPPAKKSRRNSSNVETALKQIGTQHQATTAALAQVAQALTAISQKQTALENGINSVAREIYNPQPASRSPYTVVAPDDPAMAQLAKSMQGLSAQDAPPNGMQQEMSDTQLASILGLPTMFSNGNGHRG